MRFLDNWSEKPVDPETLSRFTLKYNRWDRQTVQYLLEEMREFSATRQKLIDSVAGDPGYDIWQDLWLSLWKVKPEPEEQVRPSRAVNKLVMDEARELAEHSEARIWTTGDDIGSALTCMSLEPDVETLYDRLKEAQKLAEEYEESMRQLAEALEEQRDIEQIWGEWTEDNDPDAPENAEAKAAHEQSEQEIQESIDALGEQMGQQGDKLDATLANAQPDIRHTLREALEKAGEEAEAMAMGGAAAGIEPGTLHRLPAKQRIELAKKLNSPKFRRVAELFGSMERYAMEQQKKKVNYVREEVYDLEIGNDLDRVLPVRLAQLGDPDEEDQFYMDYLQHKLPQYKLRGQEKLSKGGIIMPHDGSGTMTGDREIWAKALGIVLLRICNKQNRPFYGIQFSSAGQLRPDDFRDPKKITPDAIIDFAEFFFGGGTDFMSPLSHAVDILDEEFRKTGAVKSDIVFVTDGLASVTDSWFKEFKQAQERLEFTVWGIMIGGDPKAEPFYKICDGNVCTIKDLTSGTDVGHIFRAI